MPVVEVHLLADRHPADRVAGMLATLSQQYAEILDAPIDRVRAFMTPHASETWFTAGAEATESAPYFTAIVLTGRPVEQRQRLLAAFTDTIVAALDVRRELVRGRISEVDPDDWGIGGVPASALRRDEIAARAATADGGGLAARLERRVRTYFEGCNEADVEKMAACFTPDAVHYFPPGMYGGPFRGARTIAERWATFVRERGSAWTVDRLLVDAASYQAVMEWTHWKTAEGQYLRGDEWYVFDPDTELISEIRAYYTAPVDRSIDGLELDGFDYAGRGYPLACPVPRPPRPD